MEIRKIKDPYLLNTLMCSDNCAEHSAVAIGRQLALVGRSSDHSSVYWEVIPGSPATKLI